MDIPAFVITVLKRLKASGHEAFIVGGALRDLCMGRPVADWDIATSATVDEIKALFSDLKTFSLKHETVTLVHEGRNYEVSAFRGRRLGGGGIGGDLSHRDFTMNAMARDPIEERILDPFMGRRDIARKRVRAVENPEERFREDPLRVLRAARFATELGFRIEPHTLHAAERMAGQLGSVASERVRDELLKLLVSPTPSRGVLLMRRLGLLAIVVPELLEGAGMKQNPQYHRFTVFKHTLETLDRVEADPVLRLSALLHDIAKPRVREKIAGRYRFYGHAKAGALLSREIMERLRFGNDLIDRVTRLIALHMRDLDYHPGWTDGAVRRLIRTVGEENMPYYLSLRWADLQAHGIEDRKLGLFSELRARIGRLIESPFPRKTRELAIDGHKVMEVLGLRPGPEVGSVMRLLMERVIDDPSLNTEESLLGILERMKRPARKNPPAVP